MWEEIDGKDLPNDDRVEHTIAVDSEEIQEEFQATSAIVRCGLSAQFSGQISEPINRDKTSSVQLVSADIGSSWYSVGKRPRTEMEMAEGSEGSGISRDSKRMRVLRVEEIESQ